MHSIGFSALAGLVLACTCVYSQTMLDFRPLAAKYSTSLNRIIFTVENPNQLHVYDPATQTDATVDLPGTPLSLSLQPNGFSAAVGMDSKIVLVNLSTRVVTQTLNVTGLVRQMVAAKDYIHYNTGDYSQSRSVAIGSGAITTAAISTYDGMPYSVLDATGNYIYLYTNSNLARIDVSTGPMSSIDSKLIPPHYCSGLGPVQSGNRLITPCGGVYTVTADLATDRQYLGTLPLPLPTGTAVTVSETLGRFALIAGVDYNNSSMPQQRDNQIYLFHSTTLQPAGRLVIADFKPAATAFQAHGKWMFFDSTGSTLHVISQADQSSGLLRDFALQSFPISNPDPCVPELTPASSVTAPWNGMISTIAAAGASSCQYTASSSADWLQLVSPAQNSGTAEIRYQVRTNFGTSARSATLTVGGQAVTVTQDAAPAPLPSSWQMSYSVADVEKSESLDKLV